MMATSILLADDHPVFRQSLKALLEREGFNVIAEADNGLRAVSLARQLSPEVAVLDIGMPLLNGIEAAKQILKAHAATQVVLLTMYEEDIYVLEALRAGVKGYVLKSQAGSDLVKAIHKALRRTVYLSPGVSRDGRDAYRGRIKLPSDPLTERERQVLSLIADGKTTKEVAVILGISAKTADSHRSHLMEKLKIHETASLVRYAVRQGIVRP